MGIRSAATVGMILAAVTCPPSTQFMTAAAASTRVISAGRDSVFTAARASAPQDAEATGSFRPPVSPITVLTSFAPPATRYGGGHRGVDLAAPAGATIRSAGAGVVIYAAPLAGRGVVSVEHAGGLRTTYEPVTAAVTAGQRVSPGTVLGRLEAGHSSCAPASCLHWGARMPDRIYLDPLALLGPWRVRLKPWAGMA